MKRATEAYLQGFLKKHSKLNDKKCAAATTLFVEALFSALVNNDELHLPHVGYFRKVLKTRHIKMYTKADVELMKQGIPLEEIMKTAKIYPQTFYQITFCCNRKLKLAFKKKYKKELEELNAQNKDQ